MFQYQHMSMTDTPQCPLHGTYGSATTLQIINPVDGAYDTATAYMCTPQPSEQHRGLAAPEQPHFFRWLPVQ